MGYHWVSSNAATRYTEALIIHTTFVGISAVVAENGVHHLARSFSDDVSQFLTGTVIPAHITSLPAEVKSKYLRTCTRMIVTSACFPYKCGVLFGGYAPRMVCIERCRVHSLEVGVDF